MPEPDDITLLKQYVGGDETAFTVLFERYVHLVYSAALRQARNPSHAEEITQAVFILLAQKAKSLSPKTVLSGWLYQAARLTMASLIKREARRQRREQEVYMQILTEPETSLWEQISPLLDDAMGRLGQQDRNAIVLRFFENKTPQEVAAALKLNEVTARKRVSRALEKLRNFFAKRGVVLTTAVIAGTISDNSVHAAPVTLANSAAALAKGATVSASTLTLVKGALKIMAWTKTKITAVVGVAGLLALTTGMVVKLCYSPTVKQVYFYPDFDNLKQVPAGIVSIQRTSMANSVGDGDPIRNLIEGGSLLRAVGCNVTFRDLMAEAYDCDPGRVVLPADAPKNGFDFLVTVPSNIREHLQTAIRSKLGYFVHHETLDVDVLKLEVANTNLPCITASPDSESEVIHYEHGQLYFRHKNLDLLLAKLEEGFGRPVLDETGLTDRYDFSLAWDNTIQEKMQSGAFDLDGERKALAGLGLKLESDNEVLDMLVVQRAK